jgi:hypothetical protein
MFSQRQHLSLPPSIPQVKGSFKNGKAAPKKKTVAKKADGEAKVGQTKNGKQKINPTKKPASQP